jgi:deoxycytidylate deaminase
MTKIPDDCKGCRSYAAYRLIHCMYLREYMIGASMEYPDLKIYCDHCPCRDCLVKSMCTIHCEDSIMFHSIYKQRNKFNYEKTNTK